MSLVVDHPASGVRGRWLDRPERPDAVDAALIDVLHHTVDACDEPVIRLEPTDSLNFCTHADLDTSDEERAQRLRFLGIGHRLVAGAWGLPSMVGRGRAMDLCLTTRWVDATEAMSIGVIDRVMSDPRDAALSLTREDAAADHDAVARLKSVIVGSGGFAAAVEDERAANAEAWTGSVTELQRNPR